MIADAIKHIVSENTRSEINPNPLTAVHDYIRCFFIFQLCQIHVVDMLKI